jgi:hypothetical protein
MFLVVARLAWFFAHLLCSIALLQGFAACCCICMTGHWSHYGQFCMPFHSLHGCCGLYTMLHMVPPGCARTHNAGLSGHVRDCRVAASMLQLHSEAFPRNLALHLHVSSII